MESRLKKKEKPDKKKTQNKKTKNETKNFHSYTSRRLSW